MTWWIFEILIRRSSLDYQYSDLERQGSVKLGKDLSQIGGMEPWTWSEFLAMKEKIQDGGTKMI